MVVRVAVVAHKQAVVAVDLVPLGVMVVLAVLD
jgi:hypothetical protein